MKPHKLIQGVVKGVAGTTVGALGGWWLLMTVRQGGLDLLVGSTCTGMLATSAFLLKQSYEDFRGGV